MVFIWEMDLLSCNDAITSTLFHGWGRLQASSRVMVGWEPLLCCMGAAPALGLVGASRVTRPYVGYQSQAGAAGLSVASPPWLCTL